MTLNEQVADRVGWLALGSRVDEHSSGPSEWQWALYSPDGRIGDYSLDESEVRDQAKAKAESIDWEHDLGAAMELLPPPIEDKLWISIHLSETQCLVSIWEMVGSTKTVSHGIDAELATAIVKAWLPWEATQ